MNDKSGHSDEFVSVDFDRFVVSVYDVAQASLETKPIWMILNFVHAASSSAIALMPDGHESKKKALYQYCIENMLLLTFYAEKETGLATSLFDELCETGFSSELRAVLCADHYCAWLRSCGQAALVEGAIARVGAHISHPHFKRELQTVAERVPRDSEQPIEDE